MVAPEKPAALVIGAGIAGMQAALDMANAGYPVYLVERELGIGGRMAQLDKTFPTLDCASCIITPKLAEVGRNLNIHLITYSEVTQVEGELGAFRVKVRHKPRYVDLSKCVGCGLCAQVCPVSIPDTFNANLNNRQAIYRLFPQVVPNAYGIQREGRSPCRDACPASQRVPGFISLIRARRYEDAYKTIKLDNPFPGICGRICPHPCETACNRSAVDAPVHIRALKRFASDQVYAGEREGIEAAAPRYEERVGIVGAGPAGLTAAQDLTLAGHKVTVFEALPVPGGMLRVGVPAFRLPAAVIEREVQDVLNLGVELRLNTRVEDVGALLREGFSAVLVAVGAHKGICLPMEGSELEGVEINTDFLRSVRLGEWEQSGCASRSLGRVLVLGGGNVAVDCARTAVRLGAESVAMACLEGHERMLAHSWEVAGAEAEGIEIYNDRTFLRILGEERVTGVRCARVASFSFDKHGNLIVEAIPDSEHTIEADTVIFAVGQRVGSELCGEVETSSMGTLQVDPKTCMTSMEGVFAAGDAITGTATAIEAIASGHRAAYGIHRYLHPEVERIVGNGYTADAWRSLMEIELPVIKRSRAELSHIKPQPRTQLRERTFYDSPVLFAEVQDSLTEEEAIREASRCLNCGGCAECLRCLEVCEAKAIDHNQQPWEETLEVGTVLVATGFDMYDPKQKPNLGYGKYPNVMHALELERMLSASGPTLGKVQLGNERPLEEVVFIQCVGSRDRQDGNPYCSRVCCMYTAKHAHLLRERLPESNITVFYIDIRSFGKGFEEFHERVRRERVRYRRGNVSEVVRGTNGKLVVRAEDTLLSKPVEIEADLVVLATALLPRHDAAQAAQILNIEIGPDGFFQEADQKMRPTDSGVPGIYLAGVCQGPKDILDAITHAKAAAASAMVDLAQLEDVQDR